MLECNDGSFEGWYVIERDNRRINGADIEGTAEDMLAIVRAIKARSSESRRRCAVDASGGEVSLWSPRNSTVRTHATLAEGDALADQIIAKLGGA